MWFDWIKMIALLWAAFLLLEFLWVGILAHRLYEDQYGQRLRRVGRYQTPIGWAATLAHIFLLIGVIEFVLPKTHGLLLNGFLYGGLFGLITHGVYNFMNYANLKHWPRIIVFVDFLWGGVLLGVVSMFATYLQGVTF